MILIFSSFDNRLSKITSLISDPDSASAPAQPEVSSPKVVDARFETAEKLILRWDSSGDSDCKSLPWEESREVTSEYLASVDEIIQLIEDLQFNSLEIDVEITDRAETALQLAMSRLEDEFRQILNRNTVPLNAEKLHGSIRKVTPSFASNVGEIENLQSFGGDDDTSIYGHERGVSLEDDLSFELVKDHAVVGLMEIVDRMIRSGYEKECCLVYSSVRRDVLNECMSVLGVERLRRNVR